METSYSPGDAESQCEFNQRLTSFGAIVGSIAMAGQNIFTELHFHRWALIAITLTSLGGWIVFGVGALRNRRLGKTQEGKAFLETARTDELLRASRSQAFVFGFAAMLAVQVLLLMLWAVVGHTGLLSIPVAASTTIAAGVSGSVLRYHILTNR